MQDRIEETEGTTPGKTRAKDFCVALSLANALLLSVWMVLLSAQLALYIAPTPHRRIDYAAAVLNVLWLGGLFYGTARMIRSLDLGWLRQGGKLVFLAAGVFPLLELRRALNLSGWNRFVAPVGLGRAWVPLAALLLVCACLAWRLRDRLSRCFYQFYLGAVAAVAATVPVALYWVAFGNATPPIPQEDVMANLKGPTSSVRVVWVLFDEWDQRVSIDDRPAGLAMPNLDRLLRTALMATNAYPPAGYTAASIPALLLGRYLESVSFSRDGGLIVRELGGKEQEFGAKDNLVRGELAAGKRVGMVGWYHPYSRWMAPNPNLAIFSESAASGSEISTWRFSRHGLAASLTSQLGYTFLPRWDSGQAVRQYQDLLKAGEAAITNSSLDLVFLHMSVPHYPGIYNRKTGRLGPRLTLVNDAYLDNLALLDLTLADFRVVLEKSGLADRTFLVLSSDHWWRYSSQVAFARRVPFIVQAPGDTTGRVVERPFNTILTKDLITAILHGKVRNQEGVAAFLEARAVSKGNVYDARQLALPAE